jgi:hypothetical protein
MKSYVTKIGMKRRSQHYGNKQKKFPGIGNFLETTWSPRPKVETSSAL